MSVSKNLKLFFSYYLVAALLRDTFSLAACLVRKDFLTYFDAMFRCGFLTEKLYFEAFSFFSCFI